MFRVLVKEPSYNVNIYILTVALVKYFTSLWHFIDIIYSMVLYRLHLFKYNVVASVMNGIPRKGIRIIKRSLGVKRIKISIKISHEVKFSSQFLVD